MYISFLLSTFQAFGVGERFLTWIKLLYRKVCCTVKVERDLSSPVPVERGIRQDCSISGQFYSLVIEPLLNRLRSRVKDFSLTNLTVAFPFVVSAYADNVQVQGEIQELRKFFTLNEKASSVKVNWWKMNGCLEGKWELGGIPNLPGSMSWERRGVKILVLYLGTEDYQKRNWEGILEKVEAKFSKWKWLLPHCSKEGKFCYPVI